MQDKGMQVHNQHRNCVPLPNNNQVHGMLEFVVHGNLAPSRVYKVGHINSLTITMFMECWN